LKFISFIASVVVYNLTIASSAEAAVIELICDVDQSNSKLQIEFSDHEMQAMHFDPARKNFLGESLRLNQSTYENSNSDTNSHKSYTATSSVIVGVVSEAYVSSNGEISAHYDKLLVNRIDGRFIHTLRSVGRESVATGQCALLNKSTKF